MSGKLLEVGKVNPPPLHGIQVRGPGSRHCPLNHCMWDVETVGQRPVGPISSLRQQTAEDVNVGFLDHAEVIVSSINTGYKEPA
jgi:hypothetical protein